jgi:primosomal protein N' (replication factor Y)
MLVLRCHYCGKKYNRPQICPSCGGSDFELRGYGTEKVEEEVRRLFPAIRIARMDSDTMRNRAAYEKTIADFEQHKIDVLIGTQMLTKGLDFDRLQLVGILNADSMLNYPDFRAHEHAFQLMTQVSGRAGRKSGRGSVIVQTSDPQHPVIQYVLNNDYRAFFQKECEERSKYAYPPFSRLIEVIFRHKDESLLEQASVFFASLLPRDMESSVFGPMPALVARVKGLYLQKIILKIGPDISLKAAKDYLCRARDRFIKDKVYRQVQIYFDVDPV